MPDSPSFTDGRRGLKDPILSNLNVLVSAVPLAYHYISDSLKREARAINHEIEGEGDHLGSDTKDKGVEKGAINLQLNNANDVAPQGAHVLKLVKYGKGPNIPTTKYYVVTDAPEPMERNNVIRCGPSVTQIVNPFFAGLLSVDEGDTLRYSMSKASGDKTIDTQPVNHRTGATKSYSATLEDGSALPTGVSINASTGLITLTASTIAIAANIVIKVVATDVLANRRTLEGEATLILTVTA